MTVKQYIIDTFMSVAIFSLYLLLVAVCIPRVSIFWIST